MKDKASRARTEKIALIGNCQLTQVAITHRRFRILALRNNTLGLEL
jgi:hypothetical protein